MDADSVDDDQLPSRSFSVSLGISYVETSSVFWDDLMDDDVLEDGMKG